MATTVFVILVVIVIGVIFIRMILKPSVKSESAKSESAAPWECDTCGASNPPDASQCSECGMERQS
jgi:ribosomal protein L40E